MAQILKHRRGSITGLKDVTARSGEIIMATGSIGDMNGPWVFIGNDEIAGGYRPISKIYQGTNTPTISVGSHGSTMDGVPFYSIGSETLFILNKDGNISMDLTGNIEGNIISGVTINTISGTSANYQNLSGSFTGSGVGLYDIPASGITGLNLSQIADGFATASISSIYGFRVNTNSIISGSLTVSGSSYLMNDVYITGNTFQTGSINLTGDITLKGNINIGDSLTGDTVTLNSEISSSLIPAENTVFDIGSNDNRWNTSYIKTGYFDDIIVTGQTIISGSVFVEDLTDNRIVIVGPNGLLEDSADLTFDGTTLSIGQGNFQVDVSDGDIRTSGSLIVNGGQTINGNLTVTGTTQLLNNLYVSGNLEILGSATNVIIQSSTIELDDNIIRLNAYSPFERYAGFEVIDSGSSGVSASLVWDSLNDYWIFVSSSAQSSKLVGTTAGTYGSEISLTNTYFPISTGTNTIGDSLLRYSGTTLSFNTNKFTIDSNDGSTLIAGNLTLSFSGGTDNGTKTSSVVFKNSSNILGFVSTTETTDVMDGLLGYKNSNGNLVFSTVIDGGTY